MLKDDIFKDIQVIFEDSNIIVVNKPFGMLSCQDKKGIDKDLYSTVKEKTNSKDLAIINRLDRGVGGIVVFSKNNTSTTVLTEYMKNHSFKKGYLAVVCGKAKDEDIIVDFIMKNQRQNISKIVNKNSSGAKEARLSYKKVAQIDIDSNVYSLVDINLETGRHHQIRVQMANANLPLYNDTKYNKNIKRKIGNGNIGLFCYKMGLKHPITNEYLEFIVLPKNEEIFKNFYKVIDL
ncbi:RluA family pseudouridine synthase [uncultured Tyzzerella sp.]|uniref:RluA family pseudouridine synthase n=1 Tax=uncultured Tyzzerella sp. TaxID=2321398 RepID=UPI00294222F0|nr:RluA family pseudouridine synthase [uncultured Tyzzerella sp.]